MSTSALLYLVKLRSPWWRHQMETFSRYWPFVRGIHRSTVNSPHKGQWHAPMMLSLNCAWTNGWVNNGEACDSRRHRAHYDVMVMLWWWVCVFPEGGKRLVLNPYGHNISRWNFEGDVLWETKLIKVLDIRAGNHEHGAQLITHSRHGGTNQQWERIKA